AAGTRMNLKKLVAGAAIVGALGSAAVGPASGIASADPPPPWVPGGPGHDHDRPPGQWRNDAWRNDAWRNDAWRNDGHWWRGAEPPWGDGPAPWGWGPPPAPAYFGSLPPSDGPAPAPFNYWGQTVTPVWDPGFNQWGFWFFGIWIPL